MFRFLKSFYNKHWLFFRVTAAFASPFVFIALIASMALGLHLLANQGVL